MTIPKSSDAPIRPPSADAVEDAIAAFERLWQGVSQGARSSLITERNEVRRILGRIRDFIRASESLPTLNAASPDGGDPGEPPRGPAGEPVVDVFAQELRAFYDWLVSKTPDERKYVLEMLDARFCVDCGEHFETRQQSDDHECEAAEDDGGDEEGEDEDDEDAPPSSGPASTAKTDLAPAPERE